MQVAAVHLLIGPVEGDHRDVVRYRAGLNGEAWHLTLHGLPDHRAGTVSSDDQIELARRWVLPANLVRQRAGLDIDLGHGCLEA